MQAVRRVLGGGATLGVLLMLGGARPAVAQSAPVLPPLVLDPTKPAVVTASVSGPRVTVGPGMARCRTLLAEIARLAGFEVRNLAQVPDTEVYVHFSAAPVVQVVDTILQYARVDFVLVGGGGSELQVAAVFDRAGRLPPSSRASAAAVPTTSEPWVPRDSDNLPIPPGVDLPPVDPAASSEAQGVSGIPLNVQPKVIEIEGQPTWQPVEMVPVPVPLPTGMNPQPFPVTVPPTPNTPPKRPGGR